MSLYTECSLLTHLVVKVNKKYITGLNRVETKNWGRQRFHRCRSFFPQALGGYLWSHVISGGGVGMSGSRSLLGGGWWVCPGDDMSRECVCLGVCPGGGRVCPRSGYVFGRDVQEVGTHP